MWRWASFRVLRVVSGVVRPVSTVSVMRLIDRKRGTEFKTRCCTMCKEGVGMDCDLRHLLFLADPITPTHRPSWRRGHGGRNVIATSIFRTSGPQKAEMLHSASD